LVSIIAIFLTWQALAFRLTRRSALVSKIAVYKENSNEEEIMGEALTNSTSIDELIEQGFIEKYSENFERATYFFNKALSLDPIPDLAFYLIIDCYWIWNNLGKRDYALTQLQAYILNYLPQFNPELRHQFDAWMTEENIHYEK
jgi:tetratricopeptide (TPR) repeat protein